MRRALVVAAGFSLMATACGTTVPLTSQQTVGGANGLGGPVAASTTPDGTGAVSAPGSTTSTGGLVPGAGGSGGTVAGGTGTTTGRPGSVSGGSAGSGVLDYAKPATGKPVEVGIMYIKDLAAVSQQFGGDGNNSFDQVAEMQKTVTWMNQHGGLGGHPVKLITYGAEIAGNKSYDQSLQEMCSMMTEDHKVVASVISNITVTNNMATCMQKYKGLYVTDGGYMKTASDWRNLTYTASPTELDAAVLGRRMAQHMIDKGAAKSGDTVGALTYDAPGFLAAESAFEELCKANGITVVNYKVHYATSTPDLANSIAAVQSAELAFQSRNAKVVASFSSGGIVGFFLSDADQQKYYPRLLLSSNDGPTGASTGKPEQFKDALAIGYVPTSDVDLLAQPKLYSDPTFNTCRDIYARDAAARSSLANYAISLRLCQALMLVQTAAKGAGGTDITGTTLRDGLGRLGSQISAGATYATGFTPAKHWAPTAYRPMHYDTAAKAFVYDAPGVLPF